FVDELPPSLRKHPFNKGGRGMIRSIAIPGFAIAVATSAHAMTPAPIAQPDRMIIQVREGCGVGMIMVNGVCVARSAIRQGRRVYYSGAAPGVAAAGAVAAGAYVAGSAAATYPSNAPSFVSEAVVLPPGQSATVIDPDTGRQCTIST